MTLERQIEQERVVVRPESRRGGREKWTAEMRRRERGGRKKGREKLVRIFCRAKGLALWAGCGVGRRLFRSGVDPFYFSPSNGRALGRKR